MAKNDQEDLQPTLNRGGGGGAESASLTIFEADFLQN